MNPGDISIIEKIFTIGPGLLCGVALILGASKKWAFYYQLEQCMARAVEDRKEAEDRRREDATRFNEQLRASEERTQLWQRLAIEWEQTARTGAKVAVEVVKKP